jgi:predicted HTH domain antitoxin
VTLTIQLPDELVSQLGEAGRDLQGAALEAFAVEEYRARRMTHAQLGELLGLSRWETDGLLKEHQAWIDYTVEDFRNEADGLRKATRQPSGN